MGELGMNQENFCLSGASFLSAAFSPWSVLSVLFAGVVPQPGLSSCVMPLD